MSDWDVVSEKPASGTASPPSDWSVASEKSIAPSESNSPHVTDAFAKPSWADRMLGQRAKNQFVPKIKSAPLADEVKSLGEGAVEGGVYAVPLAGQLIGGVDLGRAGATGLHNLFSDNTLPQPESIAHQIVGALGLGYEPKTPQGQVLNLAGSVGSGVGLEKMLAKTGPGLIKKIADKMTEGPAIKNPEIKTKITQAADIIAARLKQHEKATGETAKDVLERVKKARAAGVPLSPVDVGGANVTALAGNVARTPGTARDAVRASLTKRDEGAAGRLTKNIEDTLAKGSVRNTVEALAETRSKEAGPLFEESNKGGSTASLEKQYETAFDTAAKKVEEHSSAINKLLNRVTQIKAKLATARDIYAGAGLNKELRSIEFNIAQKEKELAEASADKASILEHLRQSQTDRVSPPAGSIWSPRIGALLKRPDVAKGIQRGLKIEQDNAAAEGRVFNPSEYAITGMKDGEAVIGKVPTMRLLAASKEGLDSILLEKGMRDELTGRLTKEGRAVDNMRRTLVGELRRLNPKYAEALDKWAGHSASIRAIDFGRKAFANKPEDLVAELKDMTPSEQEFARLGLADTLREKLLKTGVSGDEAKSLVKSPWMREQMRPFFKSEEAFNKFMSSVTDERAMFDAKHAIMGGSQTAERAGEDLSDVRTGVSVLRGAADFARGSYWNVLHTLINLKSNAALKNNPELNDAIVKLLFDPNADISQIEKAIKK